MVDHEGGIVVDHEKDYGPASTEAVVEVAEGRSCLVRSW